METTTLKETELAENVEVSFDYSPPEDGGRESPSFEEEWELIEAVDEDGNEVELTESEINEAIEQIKEL